MPIIATILIALGTLTVVVVFVISRARQGIRAFEITQSDKAEFQELRRQFGVRRLVGGLLGSLGGLCLAAAITSPLYAAPGMDWRAIARLVVTGLLLVSFAVRLVNRHPG